MSDIALRLLDEVEIVTPSWGFGNSGTRFHVFKQPGCARDVHEKLADAGVVHALTGAAPRVALILPWDRTEDPAELADALAAAGLRPGPVRTNLFQEEAYRLGTLCHHDPAVRRQAAAHVRDCMELAAAVGSPAAGIWLPDGTNYPGQASFLARQRRLEAELDGLYADLPDGVELLLEYKLFEPAFYHTDVPDWGTALRHCERLGERARVIVDCGHHAQATNVEFIVAQLLDRNRLGAFDFNSRFYADDDLMVGAADPFQLFRIADQLVAQWPTARSTALALDQCHNVEEKVPAMIRSVLNVQEALAKAALVDRDGLRAAEQAGDVLGAYELMLDAFQTDVRPLVARWRTDRGLPEDPLAAYRESGHAERVRAERGVAGDRGWA